MTGAPQKKPTDHEARSKAASELALSMTLNAGAGSGKTSVLVARITALLESGAVRPSGLAAITFTEKAAGELLSRVRDALEARLASSQNAGELEKVGRLEEALARFGEITLTTIHSFCRDILRHESLEARFAPDTELGDEGIAAELLRRAVRAWLGDLRVRRPELWRIVEQLVTQSALVDACQTLYRYRDYRSVQATEPFDAKVLFAELKGLVGAVDAAAQACARPDDDVLIKRNSVFVGAASAAAMGASALDGVIDVVLCPGKPSASGGRAGDWGGAANKDSYVAAVEQVGVWRARVLERVHGEIVREIEGHLLVRFDLEKRARSVATFDDLLREAAELLRKNPAARARLAARYQKILIDEVQDTDPVQAEVATLLTRDVTHEMPWRASAPEAGRLFAVGDPKQSIYRFRGADVRTFLSLEEVVRRSGEGVSLTQNFRSVPGVVAWVNHVFAELEGFTPQVAHRATAALDPVVLLEATDDVTEIDAVLRYLHVLFGQAGKSEAPLVVDRDSGVLRPVEPKDVMILLPTWTKADPIADRLRASGIECVVEGGDTFFSRDEVRLCMAALRAIVEPADTEAVAFLLRGLFGLSLTELAEHKKAGGGLRYTVPGAPPGKVGAALAVLSKLHRGRAARSLSGLLDELFLETNALAVWALMADGASRLANVDKLASMVRKIEGETTSPLMVVTELLRIEETIDNKDIDRIDDDGNAVRITTFFKAKGLEAPVVILLEQHRTKKPIPHVVDHEACTVAVALHELVPPGYEALKTAEEAQQAEERRRWTYVATTRARDQLVVCRPPMATKKPTKKQADTGQLGDRKVRAGCLLARDIEPRGLPDYGVLEHGGLHTLKGSAPAATVRMLVGAALPNIAPPAEAFVGLDSDVDAELAEPVGPVGDPEGDAHAADVKATLKAATRGCVRWRAATSESGGSKWIPGVPVEEGVAEESVGARGGRVVHAVMERLDLSKTTDELLPLGRDLAELLARQAGLPDEKVDACRRIVERILKNPLIEKARTAPERWHEVPFTYERRPGSVVSGTIDLCFPTDASKKTWVVFDWKSKVPPRDSKLHAKYKEQLQAYAEALLKTLGGITVSETLIVGPHPELGVVGGVEDALVDLHGPWKPRMAELLEMGAPVPKVGFDVGEPSVSVEVFFEGVGPAGKGVVADPNLAADAKAQLEAQGFVVFTGLGDDVVAALGLTEPAAEDA